MILPIARFSGRQGAQLVQKLIDGGNGEAVLARQKEPGEKIRMQLRRDHAVEGTLHRVHDAQTVLVGVRHLVTDDVVPDEVVDAGIPRLDLGVVDLGNVDLRDRDADLPRQDIRQTGLHLG